MGSTGRGLEAGKGRGGGERTVEYLDRIREVKRTVAYQQRIREE